MKTMLITFAVGAGVVYVAAKANGYLNTKDAAGKFPAGETVANYGAPLAGGLALLIAHKLIGSAA